MSLFFTAAFASLSAVSFPWIPSNLTQQRLSRARLRRTGQNHSVNWRGGGGSNLTGDAEISRNFVLFVTLS